MQNLPEQYWKPWMMYPCLEFCRWEKFVHCRYVVKLADQMGSGCGTFASSSLLEGDINYSHWPKLGADEKVRIDRKSKFVRTNSTCSI